VRRVKGAGESGPAKGKRVELAFAIMTDSSEEEMKLCRGECGIRKSVYEFRYNGQQSKCGKRWRASQCADCDRRAKKIIKAIRKVEAPPPPLCQNCGKEPPTCCDHDHRTGAFRGWLCGTCNRGIGMLGDDIEGVRRALDYLMRSSAHVSGSRPEERARSRSR
jgi:hypothetical protein